MITLAKVKKTVQQNYFVSFTKSKVGTLSCYDASVPSINGGGKITIVQAGESVLRVYVGKQSDCKSINSADDIYAVFGRYFNKIAVSGSGENAKEAV